MSLQSVFADTTSFQETLTAIYWNHLGKRALKIHAPLVLAFVVQIYWVGMQRGHPLESLRLLLSCVGRIVRSFLLHAYDISVVTNS